MKLAFIVSIISNGRFQLVSPLCLGRSNLRFLRVSVSLPARFPFHIYRGGNGKRGQSPRWKNHCNRPGRDSAPAATSAASNRREGAKLLLRIVAKKQNVAGQ
jgi:hypothetical protein